MNKVKENIDGKIAIKLHTGEPNGPNIIPRPWVENLIKKEWPTATIVETNAYYKGKRYTTEDHRETLKVNDGNTWINICPKNAKVSIK